MKLNPKRFEAFLKKQAARLRQEGYPTEDYTLEAVEQRIMGDILTPGFLEAPHPHYKDKMKRWFYAEDLFLLAVVYENFSTLAEKYSLEPFEFLHKLMEFEHRATEMTAMYQGILSESRFREDKNRQAGRSDQGARGNDGIKQAIRDHLDLLEDAPLEKPHEILWDHFMEDHEGEAKEHTCTISKPDPNARISHHDIVAMMLGSRGRYMASEALRDYEYTIYWEPDADEPNSDGHLVQTCTGNSKRKTIRKRQFYTLFLEVNKKSV